VVALRDVATQVAQRGRLLGGLDALAHGGHAERLRELDDRGDDRARGAGLEQPVDEGLVDLDHVDGQQVLQV